MTAPEARTTLILRLTYDEAGGCIVRFEPYASEHHLDQNEVFLAEYSLEAGRECDVQIDCYVGGMAVWDGRYTRLTQVRNGNGEIMWA